MLPIYNRSITGALCTLPLKSQQQERRSRQTVMNGHQLEFGDDPRMVTLKRAWKGALRTLSRRVNEATYQSYIRTLRPVSWEEHVVTLAAPTAFARQWLQGRYAEVIRAAVEQSLGSDVTIAWVVEPLPDPDDHDATSSAAGREAGFLRVVEGSTEHQASHPTKRPSSRLPSWMACLDLIPRFTFATFVSGPSSRLAHSAAQAVAEKPGTVFSPLFIAGAPGLGKTHLLHAIAHAAVAANPHLRVVYVDGEDFTYHYLCAITEERAQEFRDYCDAIDLWLVDDIQFICNREQAKEEFNHTLNVLSRSGRQIVLTSDRSLRDLGLEERVRTRLEGGLLVEIGAPDLSTRMEILTQLAKEHDIQFPGEVTYLVANGIRNNVRALEGALTKLIAYCELTSAPFSVDVALEALPEYLEDRSAVGWLRKGHSMEAVLAAVAEHYGLAAANLRSSAMDRKTVRARQVAMFLCRQFTEYALTQIGQALGGKDHATIKRGIERVKGLAATDSQLQADLHQIEERLLR